MPLIESAYGIFYLDWMSPRRVSEIHAKIVSRVADNSIAVAKLTGNVLYENGSIRISVQQAERNAKEISRIGVSAAKAFELTA